MDYELTEQQKDVLDLAYQLGQTKIKPVRERLGLPERYVLYVGSNKPHKNLTLLIRAYAASQVTWCPPRMCS